MNFRNRMLGMAAAGAILAGMGTAMGEQPMGTAFTWQGQLNQQGSPYDGTAELLFSLHDDADGGTQVGPTLSLTGHPIEGGKLQAELDFGLGVFDGNHRWLEITVDGVTLAPRQPIMAVPYAINALNAFTSWTSLTEMPEDFADGEDNDTTYDAGTGVALSGTSFSLATSGVNTANVADAAITSTKLAYDAAALGRVSGGTMSTAGGKVGIGTSNPQSDLHVEGDAPAIRLQNTANAEAWTNLWDSGSSSFRIHKYSAAGQPALVDLTPRPDNTSDAQVRFFRETNTTGTKSVRFYKGDNSLTAHAQIGVDGTPTWFDGGNVGIGTTAPKATLHNVGDYYGKGHFWLHAEEGDGATGTAYIQARDDSGSSDVALQFRTQNNGSIVNAMRIHEDGRVSIGNGAPPDMNDSTPLVTVNDGMYIRANFNGASLIAEGAMQGTGLSLGGLNAADGGLSVKDSSGQSTIALSGSDGRVKCRILEITGGADLVESFDTGDAEVEPGTVLCIDPDNPGELRSSNGAYDCRVAGVASGAGGVNPGIRLAQAGVMDGDTPVAMTGRVYVKCSTENGAIAPGDRLTTASLPGHAMKATDRDRADGAVIGKAMSVLDADTGLVLVLVNLQ